MISPERNTLFFSSTFLYSGLLSHEEKEIIKKEKNKIATIFKKPEVLMCFKSTNCIFIKVSSKTKFSNLNKKRFLSAFYQKEKEKFFLFEAEV